MGGGWANKLNPVTASLVVVNRKPIREPTDSHTPFRRLGGAEVGEDKALNAFDGSQCCYCCCFC